MPDAFLGHTPIAHQILAGCAACRRFFQRLEKETGCLSIALTDAVLQLLFCLRGTDVGCRNLDAGALCKLLNCFRIRQAIQLADKGDDVATLAAAVAVERIALRIDRKRRCFLIVKGAATNVVAAPFRKLYSFPRDIQKTCTSLDFFYRLFGYASSASALPPLRTLVRRSNRGLLFRFLCRLGHAFLAAQLRRLRNCWLLLLRLRLHAGGLQRLLKPILVPCENPVN